MFYIFKKKKKKKKNTYWILIKQINKYLLLNSDFFL